MSSSFQDIQQYSGKVIFLPNRERKAYPQVPGLPLDVDILSMDLSRTLQLLDMRDIIDAHVQDELELAHEILKFFVLEEDFPFERLRHEHVESILTCRKHTEIIDILIDVQGPCDPHNIITTGLMTLINKWRLKKGISPSALVEIGLYDTVATPLPHNPISVSHVTRDKVSQVPDLSPAHARLVEILRNVHDLASNTGPDANSTFMSEEDLALFRGYSVENPLKSKAHYVSTNENTFIWHFYESYAETAITKPSDNAIDPDSLAEGDIYLHTRFSDLTMRRTRVCQAWQRTNGEWVNVSEAYCADMATCITIKHPLDHDFRMCPTVYGDPYYLQKKDAEKKASRQKSTQHMLALVRERNQAQVKFAEMAADTISYMHINRIREPGSTQLINE